LADQLRSSVGITLHLRTLSLTTPLYFFFFFTDPAPTDIYTLSLHDALPIWTSGLTTRSPSSSTPNSGPTTGSPWGATSRSTSAATSAAGNGGNWARRSSSGTSPAMVHPPTRVGSARARSRARPAGTSSAEATARTQTAKP